MNQQQQQAQAGALPVTREDLRDSESRTNVRITELRDDMNRRHEELRDDANRRHEASRADAERRHAELRADGRVFFGAIAGLVGVLISSATAIFIAFAL